jgi:hypothetical protein
MICHGKSTGGPAGETDGRCRTGRSQYFFFTTRSHPGATHGVYCVNATGNNLSSLESLVCTRPSRLLAGACPGGCPVQRDSESPGTGKPLWCALPALISPEASS